MSWVQLADALAAVCLSIGALLTLVAAIGMLTLPDLLSRMHAATKPQVFGLLLICLGLALRLRDPAASGLLLLVAGAQMLTSPVASHMVGRAAFRTGQVRTDLLVVDDLSDATLDEHRGAP